MDRKRKERNEDGNDQQIRKEYKQSEGGGGEDLSLPKSGLVAKGDHSQKLSLLDYRRWWPYRFVPHSNASRKECRTLEFVSLELEKRRRK